MVKSFVQSLNLTSIGLDPTAILALIQAIMAIINNCPKPAANAVRNGRLTVTQRVRFFGYLIATGNARLIAHSGRVLDEVFAGAVKSQRTISKTGGQDWVAQVLNNP